MTIVASCFSVPDKMVTGSAVPPIAKMSMICIWIETVLYGVNCIMYGLCMFILLHGGKAAALSRVLVVMSTILFVLCTAHVAASLRQLLEAFVYAPANVPGYSTAYWFVNTPISTLKLFLFDTLDLVQYSILIWRLYVVFMCNWRVIIIPIILLISLMGILYSVTVLSSFRHASIHGSLMSTLIRSAWVVDVVLNLSVTVAIAARLWWMGRKVTFPTTRINRYVSSMYVVVESGAILLAMNISILGLYTANNFTSFTIVDVASQLAALAPFLIVVQVALTGRYRMPRVSSSDFSSTALTAVVFRAESLPEEQGLEHGVVRDTYTVLSSSQSHAMK